MKKLLALCLLPSAFCLVNARTLYFGGGSDDITGPKPLPTHAAAFNGTWDDHTKNWAVDELGTEYVAWQNGGDATAVLPAFTNGVAVTVWMECDVVLNRLEAPHNRADSGQYSHEYHLRSLTTPRTLTLAGENPEIYITLSDTTRRIRLHESVELVAQNGFIKRGVGNLIVEGVCDRVLDPVVVYGSASCGLQLNSTASMNSVMEFQIMNGAKLEASLPAKASDMLNDNAVVRTTGSGVFMPRGLAGGTESFRQLFLDGAGMLNLESGAGVFYVTHPAEGIKRGVDGSSVLLFQGNASDALIAPFVVQHGLDEDVLLPWTYTTRSQPVMLDGATRKFVTMSTTPAPDDLGEWAELGGRLRAEFAFTPLPGSVITNTVLESLALFNTNGNITITIADNHTLDIASGHFSVCASGVNGTKTIRGGNITSTSGRLYLLCGHGSQAINTTIESRLTGKGMDFIKGGTLGLTLSGAATNDFTGTTYVNCGYLTLGKPNNVTALPGPVVVNNSGQLTLNAGIVNNIATNVPLTIREGGRVFFSNGSHQVLDGVVTLENGVLALGGTGTGLRLGAPGFGLVFENGGIIEHTNTGYVMPLVVLTDVLYAPASSNAAAITTVYPPTAYSQTLALSNAASPQPVERVFEIHAADVLPPGKPELYINMPLESDPARDVHLFKKGAGAMSLDKYAGRFRGSVSVLDGALFVNGPYTTQSVMRAATYANFATRVYELESTAGLRVAQPASITGKSMLVETIHDNHSVTFANYVWPWGIPTTNNITFHACGSLGRSDVTVSGKGVLGGTGGVGGSVLVKDGGTLRSADASSAQNTAGGAPALQFHIGGNLVFNSAASWQVAVPATGDCAVVHVAGNITLDGAFDPMFEGKRPVGKSWPVATFGGAVAGRMTVTQPGCSLRVDGNTLYLHSVEPGTLFLVR